MQITLKIIEEIQLGRLPPSTVMPGTRELANQLNVNRKTVVLAYDELVAQGWLSTENRRATLVSSHLPNLLMSPANLSRSMAKTLDLAPVTYEQSIIEDYPAFDNIIYFNDGLPDTRLIPLEMLSRAFRHAL